MSKKYRKEYGHELQARNIWARNMGKKYEPEIWARNMRKKYCKKYEQ